MKYISKLQRSTMLLILLMVGWVTSCPVSAQTVIEVVPDPVENLFGCDNGTAIQPLETLTIPEYGASFVFYISSGITEPAYYYNGSNIRLYAGNTFTVETTGEYIIEKIEFQSVNYKSTETTLSSDNGSVSYDAETLVYTWINSDYRTTESFVINDTQLRFTSIRITFLSSSEIVFPPKAPILSQGSCTFYEDFELTIVDTNEPAATIKYTTDGSEPSAINGLTYSSPITISAGNDVIVKAVSINENGVSSITSAIYHFVPRHKLNIEMPNKNGIYSVYFSSNSNYGYLYESTTVNIIEGENVYISYSLNSGYKCKSVILNGVEQNLSRNNFEFEMPSSDVELVINTEFDPSSPSDPQPADTTKYYNLTLVCNPSGAGSTSGKGKYIAGNSVRVYAYTNSGYVFTGWSKDGEIISKNSSFNYTMPASDVVLTANYVYNPSSPGNPQQPTLKHPLTVISSPAGAGTFSYTNSEITYGEEYYVYAYPNTGYKFKGWIVNGVAQEETSTTLRSTMTEAGASVVGLFVFDPSSPSNPGANYYNSTTGQAIIDDFTPGSLIYAIGDIIGYNEETYEYNFDNVSSLIVKGRLETSDYGSLCYLRNAATIDLSRTGGTTSVPGYTFQDLAAANILLSSEVTNIGNYAFSGCANLTSLTVYAQVPPTCSSYTFNGFTNRSNCTVFVPASAIELYSTADYWKDFTILPINTDAHILQVNLPAEASDGRYKHNSLEIVNLNSGVRQKYVISDRLLYTFNGLRKDEQYNIYMYSQSGLEIGRIENVVIPDQDIEVTFDNLKTLHTVYAKVQTSDGSDVTSQVTIEWLKPLADGTITYLRKADSLGEVPDGQDLICRVTLDNKLGVVYLNPADVEFTVTENENTCTITLVPFRSIALSGTIVDGDGTVLSGASVSISQALNGKYNRTYTAKTDRNGVWSATVLDAPETRLTYAAIECINVNDTIGAFDENVTTLNVGKVTLKSIVGARVTYGFTYRAAGADEVETYYSDYQNVAVSVFNVTQNRAHKEISLQYPILAVLDENINAGDELKLIATSKIGVFSSIEQTAIVGENQRAEVTFDIVGKGGIRASFEMTENPSVIAMLYSSKGELLKKMTYLEATAKFLELDDGDYTLVTMGQSDLMNSILRLSNYAEIGLTEGKDYVKNSVKVEAGKLTEVMNDEIPAFDESLFYYTNSSTSFSSNKSSITTGNYLTLRSSIDFKGVYKNSISNIALVVDLPEACDFVEQSVIQGPNLLPYVLDGNRLTIQLGNDYKSQVRFCVVPTIGGSFNATASVVFDYNGNSITQPIGSATSEVKYIEISVPSVISEVSFKVTGTALSKSEVRVYEDGTLLGSSKANGAGSWNVECELTNPYNLSTHSIYAEITTPAGNTLMSETKKLTYDINALQVSKVTMYHWNPEMKKTYESEFDFLNPKTTASQWTVYYPKKIFTYTIEFTANDPERISNVILYVHTADGKFVPCNAEFDEQKGMWYAEIDMGTSSDGYYPVNCSVDFDYVAESLLDSELYSNNLNHYENEKNIITEDTVKLGVALEQLGQYLANEDINIDQLIETLNGVNDVLGLPVIEISDIEYTDSQIEQLLAKGDAILNDEINSFVDNLFTQELSEINNSLHGFTINDCSTLDVEVLIEQGFEEIKQTDGNSLYILSTETSLEIVDFKSNKYVIYDWSEDETMRARMLVVSEDDFETRIRLICETISDICFQTVDLMEEFADCVDILIQELLNKENMLVNQIWDLDEAIISLKKNPKASKFLISALEAQYNLLTKEALWINSALGWLKKNINTDQFRVGRLGTGASAVVDLVYVCQSMTDDMNSVIEAYYSIPEPCPDDQSQANSLRNAVRVAGIGAGTFYAAQIVADAASIATAIAGVSAGIPSGGLSLSTVAVSIGLFVANIVATEVYEANFDKNLARLCNQISHLECHKDKDCGEPGMPPCPDPKPGNGGNKPGGGAHQSGSPSDGVQIDPSGFVYEAVPTNRVEGVQATIYYKETKEDMYGDLYEEVMLWDAEEYAQHNPLFTDENGMYRWDVPQGLWQVKFEKDGYQTAYSEWLPVPPPQLEVNIGIVQNKQPEVTEARAYEEGVEVQFDKFMDLTTLTTDNIYVTANGEKIKGEIRFIDSALADEYASEEDSTAVRYASRVRFIPETSLGVTTGEIRITVSRNVLSYAGIPMTETFTQVLDVEKEVQFITALDVKVLYGEEKAITVYALPFEAAVGRILHIENSSNLIASVDTTEVVFDEEGKAVVIIKGELPGSSQLTFSIDDVTATGTCAVDVVTEIITAEAPQSSRASGTAVYRGTKIELTTDSKNAVIYFTTDGSCPCDEEGTRRKYTVPIIINDDTQILAMTSVGNSDEDVSETVEFNYTLKRSDMDFQMQEGWTWISHNFEETISPTELASDECVSRILSQTQEVIRDPQLGLVGTLTELKANESYKVETTTVTVRQRLSNIAWNPATPITLNAGWNWLGYPVGQTMSVDEALATTEADVLDVIVGQNGFAQFDGEKWVGTLETMSPGMGYMYQSQSAKNLVYNTSIVSTAAAMYTSGISKNSPLVLDVHKYGQIMPVVATINSIDGTSLDNEEYQVAAFCGSECRGIGRIVNGLVMMNVYGNINDNITFEVSDANGEKKYSNTASLNFSENVVGDIFNPYAITINNTTGITDVKYSGNIKVSVAGDMLRIKGINADDIKYVEIYDINGYRLLRETNVSESGIRISSLNDGAYVVIVNGNGEYTYHKIAIR